ncbi:MAG TPA: carboxypeptidase-like regulatory domain-containing protein, partial [Bryobacteraceae bacterium]|nr:carboxypeptidase-like regulatory domain-containing protein [Bryobacteraceae bacterium]
MRILFLLTFGLAAGISLYGQNASLTGRVLDESGAVIPSAIVVVRGNGANRNATTDASGVYKLGSLTPGSYQISASAPQLALPAPLTLAVRSGSNTLDIQLKVVAAAEGITVEENSGPSVTTDPTANAGALVLTGSDLDALSDDPEDLQADLEALAGPSAGPSGSAIFIDGFSGGQLPPKQSIREVRINSNPFTPEFDKLGYGRIEIFTKPGSDKFHGTITYNLGTDWWNSRNPYAAAKAPFLLQETENSFSGPLGKQASFTFDVERQAVDNGSISNGEVLDSNLNPSPFSSVLRTPQRHWLLGPHVDYRIDDNNTMTLRYLYTRAAINDAGIGGFDLISRGSHVVTTFHTGQIGETSIHGNLVNETRFQFFERANSTTANTISPEIQVSGSFNSG